MVLRQIPSKLLTMEQIGIRPLPRNCSINRAAWCCAGPTGSGKTTTLASMLNISMRNATKAHHYHRGPDRILS